MTPLMGFFLRCLFALLLVIVLLSLSDFALAGDGAASGQRWLAGPVAATPARQAAHTRAARLAAPAVRGIASR